MKKHHYLNWFYFLLLLYFLIYSDIAFAGKIDTVRSVCNGNWSDTATWDSKKVPNNDSDYVIINTSVSLNIPVHIYVPGLIYISSTGLLCGANNLECELINYGPLYLDDTLTLQGNDSSYALVSTNGITSNGGGGTWFFGGNGNTNCCCGCSKNCAPNVPCAPPIAQFKSFLHTCVGQPIQFIDESTNRPSNWSWSFQSGTPSVSIKQNPTITYNNAGTYNVTLIASNYFGSDTLQKIAYLTVYPLPVAPIITGGPTIFCKGDSVLLTENDTSSFVWSTGAKIMSLDIKLSGNYFVTYTDSNSCSSKSQIDSVKVLPLPAITLTGIDTICKGDSTLLTAQGGINYIWNTGATSSNINIKPITNTTYSVIGSNGQCANTANVNVVVNPIPNATINGKASICEGASTLLNASGGTNYKWSTGSSINSIMVSPISNTSYSVMVSQNGCKDSAIVLIQVNPLPVPVVCCDSSILAGQSVYLAASGGVSYLWSPSAGLNCDTCANPIATPLVSTTYTVTITSDSGCSTASTITIDVNCGKVFVPEAFSPNGDGQNDILYVRGDCIKTVDFNVFDRWGNKVFETTDKNIGWNGVYKGEASNAGSYVYYVSATMYDGTVIEKKGNVALVR